MNPSRRLLGWTEEGACQYSARNMINAILYVQATGCQTADR